jgi:thiol-disulfide isomerase/thioredoxin
VAELAGHASPVRLQFSLRQTSNMREIGSILSLVGTLLLGVQPCLGALKVGDEAPRLDVGEWIQGDEVKAFEGDKVYLVEFWATWCGPCVASIPHLNDLHERFNDQGLVVIGQNVWEKDDSRIDPFVKSMAGKLNYRLATDNKADGGRGRMAETWLTAAGKNGIPCAFVINKSGRIASIGHPMSIKDADLEALLAEPSTAPSEIGKPSVKDVATTPGEEAMKLASQADSEILAGEFDKAADSVAKLQEMLPEKFRSIGGLLNLDLLLARQQTDEACMFAEFLAEDFRRDPEVLNKIAMRLARQTVVNVSLLDSAEKIAKPVSAAEGGSQSDALAILARIVFLRGDVSGAVDLQKQALAKAAKEVAPRQRETLNAYESGKLPDDARNEKDPR